MMKVNDSSLQQINSYERLYREQETVRESTTVRQQNSENQVSESSNKAPYRELTTREVLSEKEIQALRVFFGEEKGNTPFYGGRKVQNIPSGLLMDIKG